MRRQLTRRPLLAVAAALAIGLAVRQSPWLLVCLVPLLWILESHLVRGIVLLCAVLGCLRAPAPVQSIQALRFVQGEAKIVSVPRLTGQSDGAIVLAAGFRYVAYFPVGTDISFGDVLSITAVAHPLREGTDRFWVAKGVVGRLEITEQKTLSRGLVLLRWGRSWRDSFRAFTSTYLPPGSKELTDALCFNVETGLDDDLQEDLRRTGTVHIISASGLHVGIFAVVLQCILSRAPIPRPWQLLILMMILVAYMGATGMRPPVVRAVIMAAAMLAGYLWRQESDLLSALGLATSIQLAWDPWSVFDLGLHLSFMAVLGLGLFVRFDEETGPDFKSWFKTRTLQTAYASLVAGLATAPIVAWHFGMISVISVFANLLVTPLVGVIVPVSIGGWALSFWAPLAQTAMLPVGWACAALEWIVTALGGLSFAAVDVPYFHALWIPVMYLAMIGLWREHVRPA